MPVERLDAAFFDLRSGLASDMAQTCANYRIGLALVGGHQRPRRGERGAWSVRHGVDRGRHVWFVADDAELERRLGDPAAD